MSFDILDESSIFRDWRAKVAAESEARGEARGEVKGIAEGELIGLRRSARLILTKRFGELDAETLAAIDAANATTLESALIQSWTDSLEQIRAQLRGTSTDTPSQP